MPSARFFVLARFYDESVPFLLISDEPLRASVLRYSCTLVLVSLPRDLYDYALRAPLRMTQGYMCASVWGYSSPLVLVFTAGDFSAVSHRRRVGWRVYAACRFYRRDFSAVSHRGQVGWRVYAACRFYRRDFSADAPERQSCTVHTKQRSAKKHYFCQRGANEGEKRYNDGGGRKR